MAAGATWAAEGFFAAAPSIAEGRAGAAEGPSPEVVLAAGAASAAEVFFVAAPSIAEGRTGATWAAAGVGGCTAASVEAFAEAAETRAVSAATEGPCIAAAGE